MATQELGNNLTEKPILIDTLSLALIDRERFLFVSAVDDSPAGIGAVTSGVLHTDALTGERMSVMRKGISIVKAGGVVAKGVSVQSDTTSRAITFASGHSAGISITAASQAGDYMLVDLS